MNAILLKHNSIRSYLLSSITSGSLRFSSFSVLLPSPKYQLSLFSPSSFYFFSIRHGHSSKPFGHARSILNILSKKPPNPNMLSSSPALPSPINIDHKLPSLDSKTPPNISSSSLPTNSSAYSDNKLPVLNSTTSRKHLNDLIPSSVNPIKTTSNSIPSTVQQQGLGNALITAGSNLFFSDKYAKPKSSSAVVHQAPKDLTPEQLHVRLKQETMVVITNSVFEMSTNEISDDSKVLKHLSMLAKRDPHYFFNREGQVILELLHHKRFFSLDIVNNISVVKIIDPFGLNKNLCDFPTIYNAFAMEFIKTRYAGSVNKLGEIDVIATCIYSHDLKTRNHTQENIDYMLKSHQCTKNTTSDFLIEGVPFDLKSAPSYKHNYIVFMNFDSFETYKTVQRYLYNYDQYLQQLISEEKTLSPFNEKLYTLVKYLKNEESMTVLQKQHFFNKEVFEIFRLRKNKDRVSIIVPNNEKQLEPNSDLFTEISKIKMSPSRSTNAKQCTETFINYINTLTLKKKELMNKYTKGAYSTSIDFNNSD